MSIFTTRPTAPLTAVLESKSAALRSEQSSNVELSEYHARAAAEASTTARTNAAHAEAVEQAYAILTNAGVTV